MFLKHSGVFKNPAVELLQLKEKISYQHTILFYFSGIFALLSKTLPLFNSAVVWYICHTHLKIKICSSTDKNISL